MPVDRNNFVGPFTFLGHRWQCPTCGKNLLTKDKIEEAETADSFQYKQEEGYGPETYVGRFTGLLKCTNPQCMEHVAVAGTFTVSEDDYYDDNWEAQKSYTHHYAPTFMEPAPHLFPIPKESPPEVEGTLLRAFGLFWTDHGATANAIRAGVEALLDNKGVARKAKAKGGKRLHRISLHDRILRFKQKNESAGDFLEAIKWLGNSGSHGDVPEANDLLNGFDFFEQAIHAVYVKHAERLAKVAKSVNRRKGRPARKKKSAADSPF